MEKVSSSKISLSDADVTKSLIKLVKERPILYESAATTGFTKDQVNLQEVEWNEIYVAFNGHASVDKLKQRWKQLRQTFNLNKGNNTKNKIKWKFFDHMQFLDRPMKIEKTDEQKDDSNRLEEITTEQESKQNYEQIAYQEEELRNDNRELKSEKIERPYTAQIDETKSNLPDQNNRENNNFQRNISNFDDTDHYCASLATSLRALSPKDRMDLQIQILQLISQKLYNE